MVSWSTLGSFGFIYFDDITVLPQGLCRTPGQSLDGTLGLGFKLDSMLRLQVSQECVTKFMASWSFVYFASFFLFRPRGEVSTHIDSFNNLPVSILLSQWL